MTASTSALPVFKWSIMYHHYLLLVFMGVNEINHKTKSNNKKLLEQALFVYRFPYIKIESNQQQQQQQQRQHQLRTTKVQGETHPESLP
jgi:hypothetical protein